MRTVFLSSITACAAQDVFLAVSSRASKTDLARARTTQQSGRVAGTSAEQIASKINGHLESLELSLRSCDEFSHAELNEVVRAMFPHFLTDLQTIYEAQSDSRLKRFTSLEEFERRWAEEAASVGDDETLRDAKCAEALMLWAHHLSEDGKQKVSQVSLPRLPVHDADKAKASNAYESSFNCITGHNMQSGVTTDHVWPHWPEDLHYTAKGHGAYPFWSGGGSDSGTADLEVWWSERLMSEKFYHSTCTQPYLGTGVACVHLMIGAQPSPAGYLYTADESKCCLTQPTGSFGQKLAPSQGDFMDDFTYQGEVDFAGDHYTGKAKYYLMKLPQTQAVQDFWYFTDLNGMPVEQGEGGKGPTDQGYPVSRGHTIWHDYDQSSFDTSAIDASIYDIPAVCKTATKMCAFP